MARKKIVAANWKMNKNPAETSALLDDLVPRVRDHLRDEIIVCPPFVDLHAALEATKGSQIAIGAQNAHWKDQGAFTGEISCAMLRAIGCTHVIVGHSERRQNFGESDEIVNLKLKAALDHGLTPIMCVGEALEDRDAGRTEDVLSRQCARAFREISAESATRFVIAYEPVWAIGTGKTASPEIASSAHMHIRGEVSKAFGEELAASVRILYGGSVKPDNAKALLSQEEIDGALVGGACLDAKSFAAIVKY